MVKYSQKCVHVFECVCQEVCCFFQTHVSCGTLISFMVPTCQESVLRVCVVVQKNIFMSRLTCSSSSISSGDILSISPAVPHSVSPTSLRGGNASLFTMIESKHTMMIHCHGSHCLCDVLLMPLRRCECSYPQAGRKAGKAAELQIAWISRWGLHGMQLQILLQILQKQYDNQMQVSTNDSCNSVYI